MYRINDLLNVSLTLLIAVVFAAAVSARDWRDLPGNQSVRSAQIQTAANLNSQRNQIETKITSALNAGQITAGQAGGLRAQLSENLRIQQRSEADGLSFADAQSLLTSLNSIDSQLQSFLSTSTAAPSSAFGGRDYGRDYSRDYRRGRISNAELDQMRTRISSRIEQGRTDGRLSVSEYNRLKAGLDRIASSQNRMMRYRGYLSMDQRQRLRDQYRDLELRVRAEIHDREYAGDRPYF